MSGTSKHLRSSDIPMDWESTGVPVTESRLAQRLTNGSPNDGYDSNLLSVPTSSFPSTSHSREDISSTIDARRSRQLQHGPTFNIMTPAHFLPERNTAAPRIDEPESEILDRDTSQADFEPPRKRGRPPGAKNKLPPAEKHRSVGRPRGTGPKQREAAQKGELSQMTSEKRAVGRPRKVKPSEGVSVEFGRMIIPLTRSRLQPPAMQRGSSLPGMDRLQSMSRNIAYTSGNSDRNTVSGSIPPNQHAVISASEPTKSNLVTSSSDRRIIPEEDPQRPVDIEDEGDDDVDPEISGDGIGEDVEYEQNEDEAGDEMDPRELHGDEAQDGANSRPRRALPAWLLEPFNSKVSESRAENRNERGLPPLYTKHQTFWFPQPSTYFLLQEDIPSPQQLFNPLFFLWDPQSLFKKIPCPNCKTTLQRHSHISRPRRVVDIDNVFFIIGYRYRCPVCVHPKSGKCTVTFSSLDSRIIARLPDELAAEFPAHLSFRSGISKRLFEFMRLCFQNGMGAKPFADAIRVQHLLKYDELHLQYLNLLAGRGLARWTSQKYKSFPTFDDATPEGRHGFTPSSQWIRDMYDRFIESRMSDFNQHTAMLSAEICALDHSHKITKHIAKINGEEIFTALLSVTNEKGELRSCNLVATKSHAQYQVALKRMQDSLKTYGQALPTLFFTDNVQADKQFLESCFPSLCDSVIPVEKYAHLEPFTVPTPPISVFVKNSASSIDAAMSTIIDHLDPDNPDDKIVVGFDSEWNVEMSANGHVIHRGRTAIIQIAFEEHIYVLQIGNMLAGGTLPKQLKILLAHPNILKAGRLINTDLQYLQHSCQSPYPFVGALDLAKYAKDRMVIASARCSLADLCATVLGKRLNKNVPERISNSWENESLTQEQLAYAASDAYACLCIYQKLATLDVPQPLPSKFNATTPVLVYSADKTLIVARGQISTHLDDTQFDGINVTRTKTVVDIEEVLVPGAIMASHQKRALSSFGTPPFSLVCLRNHLRVFSPSSWTQLSQTIAIPGPDSAQFSQPDEHSEGIIQEYEQSENESSPSIGDIIIENSNAANLQSSESTNSHTPSDRDSASASEGQKVLAQYPNTWDPRIRSRVLKDVFHVFNMFRIVSNHGLRVEFARQLRDAIFIPDGEDRARINAEGATWNPPQTFEQIRQTRPKWLWRRCKRIIPPPDILFPLVLKVLETYGSLKDAKTGVPLFNHSNWKTAGNVMDLIRHGHISDPPGIALYTVIGIDKKAGGLPIYRCSRGTNATEGSVHTHLRSHLPSSGASVRHALACLLDFTLRHNLSVGTFNSTGQKYRSHFSIWLTNSIQERLSFLQDVLIDPVEITGWVNGNLYLPTTEVLGILPIPPEIRVQTGMAEYIPSVDGEQRHAFLAMMQRTRKPILPVHNNSEKQLFRHLMENDTDFNKLSITNTPDQWRRAAKIWNHYADENPDISYKLGEQLNTYYSEWKTNLNVKESLSMTYTIRKPLALTLNNPLRSSTAPRVPENSLRPHAVNDGLLPTSVTLGTFNSPHHSSSKCSHRVTDAAPISLSHGSGSTASRHWEERMRANQEALAKKRVQDQLSQSKAQDKIRRTRSCAKCGRLAGTNGCSGAQNVKWCRNHCRDCGSLICRGRNTKRPQKPCREGWKGVEGIVWSPCGIPLLPE